MHLKSYAVDNRVLRTGAANFSPSGLKSQDNDIVILDDTALAAKFEAEFARIWEEGTIAASGSTPRPDQDSGAREP